MPTFEEVTNLVNTIISNPDTAPTAAQALLEAIRPDYEQIRTLSESTTTLSERIRTLQDTNQQLFLRQTGTPDNAQQNDNTGNAQLESILNMYKGVNNNAST